MIITEWCGVRPGHVEVTPRSGGLMMHNDWSSGRRTAAVTLTMTSALSPGWGKHDNRRIRGRTGAISHFTELLGQQHASHQTGQVRTGCVPNESLVPSCTVPHRVCLQGGHLVSDLHKKCIIGFLAKAVYIHFIAWLKRCSSVQYDFARCFRLNRRFYDICFALLPLFAGLIFCHLKHEEI